MAHDNDNVTPGRNGSQSGEALTMTTQLSAISIDIDTRLFSTSAVMRAMYKFSGAYHVALQQPGDTEPQLRVTLRPKSPQGVVDEQKVTGDFLNELLDQRLREALEAEFGTLRQLIVAQAFADVNLLDPTREDASYVADPLNIGASRG
jgi:His-Xaa-Ser system protein HxsD